MSTNGNEIKRQSVSIRFLKRLVRERPLGAIAGVVVLALLFCGIFADYIAPYGMNEINSNYLLNPPEPGRPFGSDNLGRDIFSRVVFGARISLVVGFTATIITLVVSNFIGMLSAYLGGKFDIILQRFIDAWLCFPGLVVLLILVSLFGHGLWRVTIIIGITWGLGNSRITRGLILSMKQDDYINAARAIGCSTGRILLRHLLPNTMPLIIVGFSILVPELIIAEASLSFLGMGVPPPNSSWGGMLGIGSLAYMYKAPWMAIWPGVAIAVTVYSVNMFGDALRDLLDPKLKGGAGSYHGK